MIRYFSYNFFIISIAVVGVLLLGNYIMERNFNAHTPAIGEAFETMVQEKQSQPTYIFKKFEEKQLYELLVEKKIVLSQDYVFIPGSAYSDPELYGKVVFPKKKKFGQEPIEVSHFVDLPLIENDVAIYLHEGNSYSNGMATFVEMYYFGVDHTINKIFRGEGTLN